MALRLGYLDDGHGHWNLRPQVTKDLLSGKRSLDEIGESDVIYETRQKGVDMKIGVDIASLAFKQAVDQIILVAGDSDFPAAKLARREGIDFILAPMWNPIKPDLHEHIDGLISGWPKPIQRN
ncbi:MAG: NYN domain-containing protein [Pseudomonadota bacterium]